MIIATCIWATLTFYSLTGGSEDNAAYGGQVVPGETCAVSNDLSYLRGITITIDGVGDRLVNDKMGQGQSNKIDLAADGNEYAEQNQKVVEVCWDKSKD